MLVWGFPEGGGFSRVLEMGITEAEGAANKPPVVGGWVSASIVGGLQV